mmetsp:Transcript_10251/g.35833  ORF Transcript_10251/g.35833 Transcript_10251/m.35833 type:complete len:247 (-) Transcript_10251:162-902(-)|eukprot:CAMPEP_0203813954 /NCGR_PEP_ID=MMETSP0115-20131106/5013_1 /ASSEMBLY_ACC=CAM_ASM_000227 /TAXON_ID=33651 /ORGANISM="Bicosoecid sp, Strain ms1" /LENGTH=246 /DNA_ID=CAMNT_0050722831 /DNA_START=216 /DNA_END=956 /DNA_ORIENTATION=+
MAEEASKVAAEGGAGGAEEASKADEEAEIHTPRRAPLHIPDDFGWDIDLFTIPAHYRPYVDKVMLPRGMIKDRVQALARDIRQDYGKVCPHLLCVLKGAHAFFADLSKAMNRHHEFSAEADPAFTFDFVRVKSYEGDHSTGTVKIQGMSDVSALKGRHVLVVEDIIDTGLSMTKLIPHLLSLGCKSVRVTSLLQKRSARACGFKGDYVGFDVPDAFLVGYNMDFNEAFRDMRHLCVINKAGHSKFS